MALTLVADSVNTAGDRLTTVLIEQWASFGWLSRLPGEVAVTAHAGRLLVTAPHLGDLLTGEWAQRLDVVATTARRVNNDWMHAPFITPDEWARFDLSLCGILSGARCAAGGRRQSIGTEIDSYLRLLAGRDRGPLEHVALPASHHAFAGLGLKAGRFGGWLTWADMLHWRGLPW